VIVCCGENLIDMVPSKGNEKAPYGSFRVAPGGCPYNSAIAAARLGAGVYFLGKMASDFLGDKLYGRLEENGVKTGLVIRSDKPVLLAFVEKSPTGEARYAFYAENAADRSLEEADLPTSMPVGVHYLLIGSISLVLEPAATAIFRLAERERSRLLVSFDPNIRPSLIPDKEAYLRKFEALCAASAIIKASDSDLEWIYGSFDIEKITIRLLELGPDVVFLTMGEKGSLAATKRARVFVEAFPVNVVDTIGAGDTFHAAILTALDRKGITARNQLAGLGEDELRGLLRFASAAAAINCTREGADPPRLDEVEKAFPGII